MLLKNPRVPRDPKYAAALVQTAKSKDCLEGAEAAPDREGIKSKSANAANIGLNKLDIDIPPRFYL